MRKIAWWAGEKGKKDFQGYGVFGGSSVVVCEGPVLQWGGAWRRINGRDCGGEVRRWERRGSHGHCGGLQSVICSHQRILEHTAVATELCSQLSIPEGLTHCQITRYRGQQGHRNHHEHWHTCTHAHVDSAALNVRCLIQGWEEVEPMLAQMCLCVHVRMCVCYCCILYVDLHALRSSKCWWAKSFWLWFCTAS